MQDDLVTDTNHQGAMQALCRYRGDLVRWGVGVDPNTTTASLRAVVSAYLRQHP